MGPQHKVLSGNPLRVSDAPMLSSLMHELQNSLTGLDNPYRKNVQACISSCHRPRGSETRDKKIPQYSVGGGEASIDIFDSLTYRSFFPTLSEAEQGIEVEEYTSSHFDLECKAFFFDLVLGTEKEPHMKNGKTPKEGVLANAPVEEEKGFGNKASR
ncbi:hypothetical protein OIU79_024696 [Salix purpurea]|uniref:Uncharacterized protein n=1 Tax=Salix purpurea TaxID=77065 RepID=A0A9Q0W2V7_SALPP|nr:hypothetical protein OIU79_024696 [Salix purpurea]